MSLEKPATWSDTAPSTTAFASSQSHRAIWRMVVVHDCGKQLPVHRRHWSHLSGFEVRGAHVPRPPKEFWAVLLRRVPDTLVIWRRSPCRQPDSPGYFFSGINGSFLFGHKTSQVRAFNFRQHSGLFSSLRSFFAAFRPRLQNFNHLPSRHLQPTFNPTFLVISFFHYELFAESIKCLHSLTKSASEFCTADDYW